MTPYECAFCSVARNKRHRKKYRKSNGFNILLTFRENSKENSSQFSWCSERCIKRIVFLNLLIVVHFARAEQTVFETVASQASWLV